MEIYLPFSMENKIPKFIEKYLPFTETRSTDAKEKVLKCLQRMQAEKVPINFNSVHIQSGLSKT